MKYLHTMIRTANLDKTLDFYINKLGLVELRRYSNEESRFTLVFISTKEDLENAKKKKSPLLEITYNWPDNIGKIEKLDTGRSFGHIAFSVKNIYEFCQNLLDNDVIINRPPRDGYMAFIKSPDNISIELLQQGSPLEVKEPWKSMPNIGSW